MMKILKEYHPLDGILIEVMRLDLKRQMGNKKKSICIGNCLEVLVNYLLTTKTGLGMITENLT